MAKLNPQDQTPGDAPEAPTNQSNENTTENTAGTLPVAAPTEADLAAREKEIAEREAAAQAILDKAEAAQAALESKVKEAQSIATDTAESRLAASNEEKANILKSQIELAHPEEAAGELVKFKPRVTLTNLANQVTLVFEKGVTYEVPVGMAEDLQRREQEYLDYEASLHIREERFIHAGNISGGGK